MSVPDRWARTFRTTELPNYRTLRVKTGAYLIPGNIWANWARKVCFCGRVWFDAFGVMNLLCTWTFHAPHSLCSFVHDSSGPDWVSCNEYLPRCRIAPHPGNAPWRWTCGLQKSKKRSTNSAWPWWKAWQAGTNSNLFCTLKFWSGLVWQVW